MMVFIPFGLRPSCLCLACLFLAGLPSESVSEVPPSAARAVLVLPHAEAAASDEHAAATEEQPLEGDQPSEAERIASLQRSIESSEARLRELEVELASPDSEYAKAERAFRELDRELESHREDLNKLKSLGETATATALERTIETVEKQWALAKDRFDLAIEERKTLREESATLKIKLDSDRAELAELTGTGEPPAHDDAEKVKDAEPSSADSEATMGEEGSGGTAETESSQATEEAPDTELIQAEEEADEKEKQAQEADEEVQEIAARIANLQKIISQEQKGLDLTRKKADLALATQKALEEELARKQTEGVSASELDELRQGISDSKARYSEARKDVTESTDRLNDNRAELASLQQQQIIALQEAEKRRLEAEAAQEAVDDLRNPFALRNILKWLIGHGPKIIVYLIGMIVLLQAAKIFSHRIIKLMTGATGRGTSIERENRAQTLVGVFQNAASVTIVIGGTLIILDEMGAKVGVLLGGVAVVGLAVAFGAQNLIKDYFYGFVMLLENQYMLNDFVKIGDLTGQVERITLRMTVLRDPNGVVHFIPNGQINCLSNETHGWSRAVFEVGIAYKENVDRCIELLASLGHEMRRDPTFGPMIIDDPTTPAVDQLADSSVVLKFFIKTRPHQQNVVRRELLRRIKNRFDELGIEIPFPQRTVYHRYEGNAPAELHNAMKKCA